MVKGRIFLLVAFLLFLWPKVAAGAEVFEAFKWGDPGDTPLVGDFGGDDGENVGIFRPSTAEWFMRYPE